MYCHLFLWFTVYIHIWLPVRELIKFKLAVLVSVARLHDIWRMTASLPAVTTSPRVRFHELAQVWAIAHSLLLDRVCGTTYMYLSVYVSFAGY